MNPPPPCCHRSYDEHVAEVALLATLLVEHDLLGAMIEHLGSVGRQISGLVDAHSNTAVALSAWKRAGGVTG